MPKQIVTATGKITHLFAHRFVLQTAHGAILADLTPEGAEHISLRVGDEVIIEGEMKPSELKVAKFVHDGKVIVVPHKKHHDDHHHHSDDGNADPKLALRSARAAGFETVGAPRRKPKHFEVLGKRGEKFAELHIAFDGHIRKIKDTARDDDKWAEVLAAGIA